jgi:GT2 family glycosyltransferase
MGGLVTSVPVILRAHNDQPILDETLAALSRQTRPFTLYVFDNASSDGSREAMAPFAEQIVDVPAGAYVPERVLNAGMRLVEAPVVVFLNADCTPQHDEWLERLLAPFEGPGGEEIAAVFGRQVPRSSTHALHARDTEDAYGDGSRHASWQHFFSMAASAIRREDWQVSPFDESLQYSEDIDWTWRLRQRGRGVRYVPDAVAMHSHNYTFRQLYRRHVGEGAAEAHIFDWSLWKRSFLRYTVIPLARMLVDDLRRSARLGEWRVALEAPWVRLAQVAGRRAGFREGLKTLQRAKRHERSAEPDPGSERREEGRRP